MSDKIKAEDILPLFRFSESFTLDVIRSLKDVELLKELFDYYQGDYLKYGSIIQTIEDRICALSKKKEEKAIIHNTPIEQLLEQLKDKSTRKEAAKQVKQRFLGLDYSHQLIVMDAFLNMSASYRTWCYTILRDWREPSFDDRIIELWKTYKEKGCQKLIISTLPEEKVKMLMDNLTEGIRVKDYFTLIKRFGKADWFNVDTKLLADLCGLSEDMESIEFKDPYQESVRHHFYYLLGMSMTRQGLSKEECGEIIYLYIQNVLKEENLTQLVKDNVSLTDARGNHIAGGYDLLGLSRWNDYTLSKHLQCLLKMGHYDLVSGILSWMYAINKQLPAYEDHSDSEDYEQYCKDRLRLYYQLSRESLPVNCCGIETTPLCTFHDIQRYVDEQYHKSLKNKPAPFIVPTSNKFYDPENPFG